MKYTLLELTQNILSSLDSDEVNSINDTTESRQVAEIIRTKYFDIIARADLSETRKTFNLNSSNDVLFPTLMFRPEDIRVIDWIKYDKSNSGDPTKPEYDYVTLVPFQHFMDITNKFDSSDVNTGSFVLEGITFYYKNNSQPTYCTTNLSNNYVIFDSYNSMVDDTLQTVKTACYGEGIPPFQMADSFIPQLTDKQFPLLLHEATALAFVQLKQVPNQKSETEARRLWRTVQRNNTLTHESDFDKLPNFGRIRGMYRGRSF